MIGIVDGLFDSVPAVVHKEILFAISRGVRVLGAGSMGALRAAELCRFGMEGVGRIFEKYRSGEWKADDEVAVVHGPAEVGYRAASVAMANIRFALEEARNQGVISQQTLGTLTSAAKDQFYADRSWNALYELGTAAGVPSHELSALSAFVAAERPDAKRDDALALLWRIRDLTASGEAPPPCDFDFEETVFWERLTAEARSIVDVSEQDDSIAVANSELFRHLRVQPDGQDRVRGAALLHLLLQYGASHHVVMSDDDKRAAFARFRRRHGLLTAERTRQWLAAQYITEDELLLLIELELTFKAVLDRDDRAIRTLLPLELKRRSEFPQAIQAITEKKRVIEGREVRNLTLEDADVSFADLIDWYQSTRGTLDGSIKEHAEQMGFESPREFISEVLLEYVTNAERA